MCEWVLCSMIINFAVDRWSDKNDWNSRQFSTLINLIARAEIKSSASSVDSEITYKKIVAYTTRFSFRTIIPSVKLNQEKRSLKSRGIVRRVNFVYNSKCTSPENLSHLLDDYTTEISTSWYCLKKSEGNFWEIDENFSNL